MIWSSSENHEPGYVHFTTSATCVLVLISFGRTELCDRRGCCLLKFSPFLTVTVFTQALLTYISATYFASLRLKILIARHRTGAFRPSSAFFRFTINVSLAMAQLLIQSLLHHMSVSRLCGDPSAFTGKSINFSFLIRYILRHTLFRYLCILLIGGLVAAGLLNVSDRLKWIHPAQIKLQIFTV